MRNVESWCDEQIRKIRLEAERRIADRRTELEQSVTQHGTLIETEVQSVHGAVQGYRDSLDAFFARMAAEGDPSAIAGLAGTLPDPPDLDVVRADARSRAMRALEEDESPQAAASSLEAPTDPRDTDPLSRRGRARDGSGVRDRAEAGHGSGRRRVGQRERRHPRHPLPLEPHDAAPGPALTERRRLARAAA